MLNRRFLPNALSLAGGLLLWLFVALLWSKALYWFLPAVLCTTSVLAVMLIFQKEPAHWAGAVAASGFVLCIPWAHLSLSYLHALYPTWLRSHVFVFPEGFVMNARGKWEPGPDLADILGQVWVFGLLASLYLLHTVIALVLHRTRTQRADGSDAAKPNEAGGREME